MIKPVDGKLVIEMIDSETTKSGIIVQTENSGKAKVIAVAKDIGNIKPNDIIVCDKFIGARYGKYRIIDVDDVYAILEEDE